MAKFGKDAPPNFGPSLRGAFYSYNRKGNVITNAWPKKRPGKVGPEEQWVRDRFKEAAQVMKRYAPEILETYKRAVHGKPYAPRDLLLQSLYGHGPTVFLNTGERIVPLANQVNISQLMDNIGWTPGSMLYRAEHLWVPIPPGNNGDILRYNGPSVVPSWIGTPSGLQGASLVYRSSNETASSTYPRTATWNASLYDELGAWNPSTPTRLTVPGGVSQVRVRASIRITDSATARSFALSTFNDAATSVFPGSGRLNVRMGTTGSVENFFEVNSAWLPAAASAFYEIRLNMNPAFSSGLLENSWFAMEAR